MLDEICGELRNYFATDIYRGTFEISEGVLAPCDFLKDGQYFRLVGSVFNDGVHQFPNDVLTDEQFEGEVWAMAVPPSVIALASEIEEYQANGANNSPYTAESFAGYSYQKATGENGTPLTWQEAFARRLNRWRRVNL